jgi:hypothetical protein
VNTAFKVPVFVGDPVAVLAGEQPVSRMTALCGAILRFDAVLAEEITKALDLVAQGRKVEARRRPFLLAGGLLVQQSARSPRPSAYSS